MPTKVLLQTIQSGRRGRANMYGNGRDDGVTMTTDHNNNNDIDTDIDTHSTGNDQQHVVELLLDEHTTKEEILPNRDVHVDEPLLLRDVSKRRDGRADEDDNSCSSFSQSSLSHPNASFSPELQQLLPKLRPFQRHAFNFATGCSASGGGGDDTTQKSANSPASTSASTSASGSLGACLPPDQQGRLLLADEMGLGKTVTSLAIMLHYQTEWPLLILCPASLRYTWPMEIEKFIPSISSRDIHVVSGFDDADFLKRSKASSSASSSSPLKIVVATYSLLQDRSAAAHVLQKFDFQCVIADESHNLKERNSQRCQLALPLLTKARRLILVSGTPALARPVELWPQLHCLSSSSSSSNHNTNDFGSFTQFTKNYCDAKRNRFGQWDVKGISNAEELHAKLSKLMVRRLKSDVLTELPAKQRTILPIQLLDHRKSGSTTSTSAAALKECKEIMQQLKEARVVASDVLDDAGGGDAFGANLEARRLLVAAYQASGIAKAPAVAEYVIEWLKGTASAGGGSSGGNPQKLLIFCHHLEVMNILEHALSKHMKGMGHIRIDGSVSPVERAKRVKQFQNPSPSNNIRAALLSVTAAGVGLTLTAASTVVFAELHWTPGVLAQAEDRCHRIGQVNAVNVVYCINKDPALSVDMQLWRMLSKKVGHLGMLMDGTRKASLNAKESEGLTPGASASSGTNRGISAEEELATFFAETAAANNNNHNNAAIPGGPPVKGTIQSFFLKQSQSQIQKTSSKTSTTGNRSFSATTISLLDDNHSPQLTSTLDGTVDLRGDFSASASSPSTSPPAGEWNCGTCTLLNGPSVPHCGMCGAPYVHTHTRTLSLSLQSIPSLKKNGAHARQSTLSSSSVIASKSINSFFNIVGGGTTNTNTSSRNKRNNKQPQSKSNSNSNRISEVPHVLVDDQVQGNVDDDDDGVVIMIDADTGSIGNTRSRSSNANIKASTSCWNCTVCTFENQDDCSRPSTACCQMCSSPRRCDDEEDCFTNGVGVTGATTSTSTSTPPSAKTTAHARTGTNKNNHHHQRAKTNKPCVSPSISSTGILADDKQGDDALMIVVQDEHEHNDDDEHEQPTLTAVDVCCSSPSSRPVITRHYHCEENDMDSDNDDADVDNIVFESHSQEVQAAIDMTMTPSPLKLKRKKMRNPRDRRRLAQQQECEGNGNDTTSTSTNIAAITTPPTRTRHDTYTYSEDDDEHEHDEEEAPTNFTFVVSKHTGRVAIHASVSGNSLNLNFDIADLLVEEEEQEEQYHQTQTTDGRNNGHGRAAPVNQLKDEAVAQRTFR
jgi:SWI/SNF-related matrix-associated actin-dependent regulator 1 of chromatin subfamily A